MKWNRFSRFTSYSYWMA